MSPNERQFVADMKAYGVTSRLGPDEYIVVAGYLVCRYPRAGLQPVEMQDILNLIDYKDFNVVSAIAEKDICIRFDQ